LTIMESSGIRTSFLIAIVAFAVIPLKRIY
jgi:hypothetical protein